MNKFTFGIEIAALQRAAETIRNTSDKLRNSMSVQDDHWLIQDKEHDALILEIAANLIERTLPK